MRRRLVRGGMVLVFVLALVDGVFGARGIIENTSLRKRNAQLAAGIDEFRAGNDALIEDIKRLREDPAAIEELARDELELMMDGELLIILRDAPPSSGQDKAAGSAATPRGRR